MAFIAVPIITFGLSGLSYYLYSSNTQENIQENKQIIDIGNKYSNVMKELVSEPKHPILQNLEKCQFSPSSDEIQNKKSNLKHVDITKNTLPISKMDEFILSLQEKKRTLNKIT